MVMNNRKADDKYEAIAEFYLNPASECYNNFRKSMAKAGYSKSYIIAKAPTIRGSDVFKKACSRVIEDIRGSTALSIERIQREHMRLQTAAEEKGDLATATRNLEDLGKTIAAYEDKVQTVQGLSLNFTSEKKEEKNETDPQVVKIA